MGRKIGLQAGLWGRPPGPAGSLFQVVWGGDRRALVEFQSVVSVTDRESDGSTAGSCCGPKNWTTGRPVGPAAYCVAVSGSGRQRERERERERESESLSGPQRV